jgi:hypothetical protein
MANKITVLSAVFVILMMGACKKSNNGSSGSTNPLTGTTWNFVDLTSNAQLTATVSEGLFSGTVEDVTAFTTIDNSGTITFTADSMAGSGIGYTIDTTYTTYTYAAGSGDTVTTPFTTTISPTSSSTSYQLIGSDSIYFGSGTPFSVSLYAGDTVKIEGAHFSISGNTLTLTSTINQAGNVTYNSITAPSVTQIKSTITLSK